MVAVKKIENVFDHRSLAKRTLRELKLVRTFNHENILGMERVMRPHSAAFSNIYLVSEVRAPTPNPAAGVIATATWCCAR